MRALLMAGALTLMAACTGSSDTSDTGAHKDSASVPPPPPSQVEAATDSQGAAMGAGAHLTLAPAQGSSETGASGMAMLTRRANELEVAVTVTGKPNSTLQAHIHRGRCGVDEGVAYPLTPIASNQDGTGTSTTAVPADTIRGGNFLQVHGTGGAPMLCADLPASP
jgi:hypothetical protein